MFEISQNKMKCNEQSPNSDDSNEKRSRSSTDTGQEERDRILKEVTEEMETWRQGFDKYLQMHPEVLENIGK